MAEYIERRVAAKAACDAVWYGGGAPSVTDAINKIPAADVVPVRRGRWILTPVVGNWIDPHSETGYTRKEIKLPSCSVCCTDFGTIVLDYKYCPSCGAKMDGKVKDDGRVR